MPDARFFPEVISAATAEAVEMFPAIIRPRIRPIIRRKKLPANIHIKLAKTIPPRVKISVGLRPCLSEKAPQIGAKINCKMPYIDPRIPPNRVATAFLSSPANCSSQVTKEPIMLSLPSSSK